MHFVKFHPEVASCLLSRGKRKYEPLGMRLLWKYIRNYFLVYHLISQFLLYHQNYKEFEAEILDLQSEKYGLSFDIKKCATFGYHCYGTLIFMQGKGERGKGITNSKFILKYSCTSSNLKQMKGFLHNFCALWKRRKQGVHSLEKLWKVFFFFFFQAGNSHGICLKVTSVMEKSWIS